MTRTTNTDRRGIKWSEAIKQQVWQKARFAPGLNSALFRLDTCGALIEWNQFGVTTDNGTGWEIDHILPVAHGGMDNIENLQPLQWQHNRHKGDSLANNYCFLQRK